MKVTKPQQNRRVTDTLSVTVTDRDDVRASKRPPDLQTILDSVRLIPPDSNLRDFPLFAHDNTGQPETLEEITTDLLAGLRELPEALRSHLFEYLLPDKWETYDQETPLAVQQESNVIRRFYEILRWHESLKALVRGEQNIRITAEVRPDEKGRARVYYNKDSLVSALEGVKLDLLRECKVCGHVFLAKKINQSCDTPRCANIFRKRRARKNKKLIAKRNRNRR